MLHSRSLLVIYFIYSVDTAVPVSPFIPPLSPWQLCLFFHICDSISILQISSFVLYFFRFHK